MTGGIFVLVDVLKVTVSDSVFGWPGAMVMGITISLSARCVVALSFSPIFHFRLICSSVYKLNMLIISPTVLFQIQYYAPCWMKQFLSELKSKIVTELNTARTIRRTFFPEKCDLKSTCVLYAEGKYLFPYLWMSLLLWDSKICFQIMRSGITACERLTFLSGDLPWRIHCITCDSGFLRCCSSKV